MEVTFEPKQVCKWTFLFATFIWNTAAAENYNNVTLHTNNNRGQERIFTTNVNKCISLQKANVFGKLTKIEHQENCVEVHQSKDCKFDYITIKPGVPGNSFLVKWNLNDKRKWIDEGAKAVGSCRDKCDETNIVYPEPDKNFYVTLYSETHFNGLVERVSIKGCKVIPKPLRKNVLSLKYDGSFCFELHETRNCSGDLIQIPKETPYQLTWDLKDWEFDKKIIAASLCGYNCPNSQLKLEKEPSPIKYWTDQENEGGVTLFSEPDFKGKNFTYTFNFTNVDCVTINDDWGSKGKTESIQAYNFCIDVFGKDTGCKRVEGEYHRLNYSNSQEARDIIASGWTSGIKSIAPCPTNAKQDSNFSTYLVAGFSIVFCIFGVTCLVKFWNRFHKYKKIRILSYTEINEFKNGNKYTIKETEIEADETEEALLQPYKQSYELKKTNVQIYASKILGKGTFGVAFRGKLINHEYVDEVAIKTTGERCTATSVKMLLSEIKIMIHVGKHLNVVCIIGACTANAYSGKVLLVVELCENGSLEKYLRTQFDLNMNGSGTDIAKVRTSISSTDLERLIMWSYHIASGMEHISSKRITHADLATRNVLLTTELVAKITDFGLSRHIYNYKNYVKLSDNDPLPWRWMAIESLNFLKFSTKSDVWAYGVTLWEIFSLGRTPYPGISWTTDFVSKLEGGFRLHKPALAQSIIYEIMLTCWYFNSDKRPDFIQLEAFFKDLLYRNASTIYDKME